RRFGMSIVVMFAFAGFAFPQKGADIFGGYSYQRTGGEGVNGFDMSVTGKVAPWVGLTADFGFHKKGESIVVPNPAVVVNADAKLMAFRFGPRFVSHVNDSTDLFVHVLAGAYRASANVGATGLNMNVNGSGTGFTAATGGGVDLRIAPRIAVRPVQID